jgi:5-methylcytosine-specific restriction enzyme A
MQNEINKNKRFIGKYIHKNLLPKTDDGFTCCRWCNSAVKPPRRTICSKECEHELKIRTNAKYLRECVFKRDKGICCECNIDTKVIAKEALKIFNIEDRNEFLKKYNISSKRKIKKRKFGGSLWDADHILAVKDGGGQCGLDNLRTLCISCHKKKTFNYNC